MGNTSVFDLIPIVSCARSILRADLHKCPGPRIVGVQNTLDGTITFGLEIGPKLEDLSLELGRQLFWVGEKVVLH